MADDDPFSNKMLRTIIEDTGLYQVNPFYNGLDLCNFYEEQGEIISLIILDIEMPERNGPDRSGRASCRERVYVLV